MEDIGVEGLHVRLYLGESEFDVGVQGPDGIALRPEAGGSINNKELRAFEAGRAQV